MKTITTSVSRAKTSLFFVFFVSFHCSVISQTTGNDTTIIALTQAPLINSVQDTTVTVIFPNTADKYEKIMMTYSLDKPPAGWDPWDRIGYVRIFTATDTFEIARIMTPYSKVCSWAIDVTDYRSILADTVNVNAFILFYGSNNKGYLVSISFDFTGGNPIKEAYKIQNLWGNDVFKRWEYGNDTIPMDSNFLTKPILIDPFADSVKIKAIATGHGQGNTNNAAEFSNKTHSVTVDANIISHQLWRANCGSNPCSPQSGTWQYNRAGWCPGADVLPWDVDITPYIIPGNMANIGYEIQPYHNYCSPADSNCISGTTCPDCNYNSNGHTTPWYLMQSQIIFFKNIYPAGQNKITRQEPEYLFFPNPNEGKFTLEFLSSLPHTPSSITIFNAQGRIVFEKTSSEKTIRVNFSEHSPGIYLVIVQTENKVMTKKIIYQ